MIFEMRFPVACKEIVCVNIKLERIKGSKDIRSETECLYDKCAVNLEVYDGNFKNVD